MNGFMQDQSYPGITDIITGRADAKKYSLKSILMTTYTLETAEITKLITELAAKGLFSLSRLPKITVYYHEMTSDCNRIIDSGCFIRMGNKMNERSFHPKIVLLQLEEKAGNVNETAEGRNAPYKYLLIVSSRNISNSDHLEAYAVLEGTASSDKNAAHNGYELLDFIRKLDRIAGMDDPQDWSELNNVDFTAVKHRDASVSFVTAEDLGAELAKLNDLTVVSPFLSEDVQEYDISTILSTEDALKTLKQPRAKCDYFSATDGVPLHAKIYCGLDQNNNTVLIIGSSNATIRGGLGSTGSAPVNCEFNIKLCIKSKADHNLFKAMIGILGTDFDFTGQEQGTAAKKENLMSAFTEFTETLCITSLDLDNRKATFTRTLSAYSANCQNCGFSFNGTKIASSPFKMEVELNNFFSAELEVRSKETNNSRSFYIDLLSICPEKLVDELRKKQEDFIKANRTKYSEMCIESVINGKNPAKVLQADETKDKVAERGSKNNNSRAVSRNYIYEKLMKLGRLSGGNTDTFVEKLRQINDLSVEGTEWQKASAAFIAEAEKHTPKGEQK